MLLRLSTNEPCNAQYGEREETNHRSSKMISRANQPLAHVPQLALRDRTASFIERFVAVGYAPSRFG